MSKKNFLLSNNPLFSGPPLSEREKIGVPYREIPLESVEADPDQPRKEFDSDKLSELSESIKTYGILSPILVKSSPQAGKYTIISGERRYRAAKVAGLSSVPVIIHQKDDNNKDTTIAIQLVENLQRSDLSILEKAHAMGALRDAHKLSIRDIADKLGISKSNVQRCLEVLDYPADLLNALKAGAPESKIALLSKITDFAERAKLLAEIDSVTRDELTAGIKKKSSTPHSSGNALSAEDSRITDEIQRALGLKVKMLRTAPGDEAGKLTIEFYSSQDLQELFRKLVGDAQV